MLQAKFLNSSGPRKEEAKELMEAELSEGAEGKRSLAKELRGSGA
jgi:hypothetical protein